MARACFLIYLVVANCLVWKAHPFSLSAKLVHRFSDEARAAAASRIGGGGVERWPTRRSKEYYQMLARSDLLRRKRRLGARYQMLFPSEGSETLSLGNDFGWLHYTWINIGTPNVSFLVALDAGSDLLWIPCDCIQCAPLSGYHGSLITCVVDLTCDRSWCSFLYGASIVQDKDLSMYSPAESRTSRYLSCNHELCSLGSTCGSAKQPCPYRINYYSENTSSSGLLVEDILHLATSEDHASVQASVIIGDTYIVAVESFCLGSSCPGKTSFHALIDSGSSFTFLPNDIYKRVTLEFDRQVNVSKRATNNESPWEYCYEASPLGMPGLPKVKLIFGGNKSFMVINPIFPFYNTEGELAVFCLALQSSQESLGTIGPKRFHTVDAENFMTGYHLVFDRENLKLRWSRSDCHHDLDDSRRMPLGSPPRNRPENPLPTNEQHSFPNNARAISPAVSGRTLPANSSSVSQGVNAWYRLLLLLTQLAVFAIG
ncbi:hypothetical protein C4D60_Mb10t01050 [Musa balbisiana]|uniref:Peptidase A1 domain-containing protein n=1 Tax=Musa balbisiana TaxID=52838 RepID=A0A4S8IUL9_MUSBA|nr:hypothetical protein C4D60_Mb10t01050 [Musa balbisiana]